MTSAARPDAPRIGWYGDDFTGATDMLATAARAGLRTVLFPRVPTQAHLQCAGQLDAIGIAGAARGMTPRAMQAELEPVGALFARLGVRVLHYKCCSTFDSAAHVGSIGTAVRVLQQHVAHPFVPVVGGQPNIGRYCLFSQLFASAGSAGEVHRIDRHPTMSRHPVTPMTETDLRLHLQAQQLQPVAAFPYLLYQSEEAAQDAALASLLEAQPAAVLMDVSRVEDLPQIGRLIWAQALKQPLLAVGPSGVMQALAASWGATGQAGEEPVAPARMPVFSLAGSLSPQTAAQVAAAQSYAHVELTVDQLLTQPAYVETKLNQVCGLLSMGKHVLAFTERAQGRAVQKPEAVAKATAAFATQVVQRRAAAGHPLARLGIAGGDTSSQAVGALDLWGLHYQAVLAPGVTLCRASSDNPDLDGLELMLKGGQMGPVNLFEMLIEGTGTREGGTD